MTLVIHQPIMIEAFVPIFLLGSHMTAETANPVMSGIWTSHILRFGPFYHDRLLEDKIIINKTIIKKIFCFCFV